MVRIFTRRTQRLSVSVANSDSDYTSDCEKPDGNQNENKECVTKPYILKTAVTPSPKRSTDRKSGADVELFWTRCNLAGCASGLSSAIAPQSLSHAPKLDGCWKSHLNLCAPRAHRSDHTDICRFANQKVKKFSSQTKIFIPLNISLLQTRKPLFTDSYFVRCISTFDLEKSSIYIYFSYSYIRIVFIKNCN